MKFYAIRELNGEPINKILTNWKECESIIKGNRAIYKSFKIKDDALNYLNEYIKEENEENVLDNPNNHIYYVDGSYINDIIGWGFIHIKDNICLDEMCGAIKPNKETSRNVTGELEASKRAIQHALDNGIKEIYIVNDYEGISAYATGAWKPKKQESKDYTNWINSIKSKINIKFIKVKGHTGNKFNDLVDELAKKGTESL